MRCWNKSNRVMPRSRARAMTWNTASPNGPAHCSRKSANESSGLTDCLEGKPVVWQDMQNGEWPLQERLVKADLRSAMAVPLMVEGELFGILLAARRDANAFSSGECEFLRMLSEHVALAAHQARLHTQLQSAYDELRQTQQAVMQQERLRA